MYVLLSRRSTRYISDIADKNRHIALYLSVYAPTSRLEIWRTDRYTEVSGHSELGVYATATIPPEQILHEIQGQCADIPAWWMGRSDSDNESGDSDNDERPSRVRRSLRTGRRDFSIIKSNRSKKQQLFLGPARFINVSLSTSLRLIHPAFFHTNVALARL
jgi:histone-lysine N-methyltransferase SUV420H